jgi:hypothetical protein
MTGDGRRVKATVLGGLAASAALSFGLFFVGVAWFIAAWLVWLVFDDHRTAGTARNVPVAVFVLGLLTSSLVAARFGLWVGRDWYRNGR